MSVFSWTIYAARSTSSLPIFPSWQVRTSYIQPQSIIGTILYTVEKHLKTARMLHLRKLEIKQEMAEQGHFAAFLNTLDTLFKETHTPPDFDIIGLTIKDASSVDHVRSLVAKMTGGNFRFFTVPAGDGTLAGMITIEKSIADSVSKELSREHVPEVSLPPEFDKLSLSGKISYLEAQTFTLSREIETIDRELEELGRRWIPLYRKVLDWIDERISLLTTTATIYRTQMCFYVRGWMPSDDVGRLKAQLDASFGMQVVMEEKHVREKELEHAPIVLTNPPYFKPFELLSRMLPLPAYTSIDTTPYIGIFFPDILRHDTRRRRVRPAPCGPVVSFSSDGYAKNRDVADASKILFVSSLYTILFGLLYGELFGDLGTRLFGLEPLLIERRTSVVPMMVFAISAGVVHILLGLVLGVITAFKKHIRKEAIYKLLNIAVIFGLVAVFASFFGYFPALLSKPIIIAILIAVPFLFFFGGLLGAARTPQEHRQHHFLCQDHGHRPHVGPACVRGKPDRGGNGKCRSRRGSGRAASYTQYHPRRVLTNDPFAQAPLRRVLQQVRGKRREKV